MLAGALGTYLSAAIVLGASLSLGAGILAACGWRTWSWTAPAVGLAAATVLAWWAVRLPGHGWTALGILVVLSVAAASLAAVRITGLAAAAREGAPVVLLALAAGSIPFIAEGHFGVLGSGFNVDMSQHLFAADWLADPARGAPGLFEQGYPLGPHALAVAGGEVSGELTRAFSGVTIALPAVAALTALAGLESWSRWRAVPAALLTALAYLVASYLAQGSFKELFEVTFLLGVALLLAELGRAREDSGAGWRSGVPLAVIGAGALYAYSAPGLAWLAGAALLWGALALVRRRAEWRATLRRAAPAICAALVALLLIAAPELDRIIDFGGSVGTVSESARSDAGGEPGLLAAEGSSDGGRRAGEGPKFDDDLGNLFGQISPLEALGVWPSGDFRVAPGDGAVPAPVFYLGALLGALALAVGVAAAARRGETALLAALAAAAAIWLAARIGSTPYTTAKALALIAPVAMLLSVRGVLAPASDPPVAQSQIQDRMRPKSASHRWRAEAGRAPASPTNHINPHTPGAPSSLGSRRALPVLAVAFLLAAALSSILALANAPVGPADYTPGVRELNQRFAGRPTLLLAPNAVIAGQHGEEFYGWELREASPACVAAPGLEQPPPMIRIVLTVDLGAEPPFGGLTRVEAASGVVLWRVDDPRPGQLTSVAGGSCALPVPGSAG